MRPELISVDSIKTLFEEEYVYTISELKRLLNCSEISVKKKIKKINYYSSYTHNAKYYTLSTIPKFDEKGIWFYSTIGLGDIGFTKYKTTFELIISIIESAKSGITEKELSITMKTRIANQLVILTKQDKIRRVKVGNIYYYLSANLKSYNKQYNKLISSDDITLSHERRLPKIDEGILIKVLFAVIDSFDITLDHIVREFKKNNIRISKHQVDLIMAKYELYEKKTL